MCGECFIGETLGTGLIEEAAPTQDSGGIHASPLDASRLTSPFYIPATRIHSVFRSMYGLMLLLCPFVEDGGIAKILGCISSY